MIGPIPCQLALAHTRTDAHGKGENQIKSEASQPSKTEKDGRFKFRLASPIRTQNVNTNNNNNMARQFVEGRKIVGTFISCPIFSRRSTERQTALTPKRTSYLICVPMLDTFLYFYDKKLTPLVARMNTK